MLFFNIYVSYISTLLIILLLTCLLGLLYAPTDSCKRQTLEKRIIEKLGTLTPSDHNEQFALIYFNYLACLPFYNSLLFNEIVYNF